MKVEWDSKEPSAYEDIPGELGAWTVQRIGNGQARLSLAPTERAGFPGYDFCIYGSAAEARLAIAAYEASPTEEVPIPEQIEAAGFFRREGDREGAVTFSKRYGDSGGSLVLTMGRAAGGGLSFSRLVHQPSRGVSVSHLAYATDAADDQVGRGGPAADLRVALLVAHARELVHHSHATPLADGEERPFVEALAARRGGTAPGPR